MMNVMFIRRSGSLRFNAGSGGSGLRILIVEDELPLRKQLAGALENAGYAVDCAADGEEADFLGQTETYDAVLLDLGLPKAEGLTILRRWREAGILVLG
jgi:two-component system, OmpR family, response regulator